MIDAPGPKESRGGKTAGAFAVLLGAIAKGFAFIAKGIAVAFKFLYALAHGVEFVVCLISWLYLAAVAHPTLFLMSVGLLCCAISLALWKSWLRRRWLCGTIEPPQCDSRRVELLRSPIIL